MAIIVKGHGERIDDETTFVPVGTTLKFYSGFDVDLSSVVSLIALLQGASAPAQQEIKGTGASTDVTNYKLYEQDHEYLAMWVAIGGKCSVPIKWMGIDIPDETRLCSAPDVCDGLDKHHCTGVLGRVDDTEIIIMACRGVAGEKNAPMERKYGTDPGNLFHNLSGDLQEYLNKFYKLARTDPAKAEAQVDDLEQGTLALLNNYSDFTCWQKARYLKNLAVAGKFDQMVGHLTQNADNVPGMMSWLNECSAYGTAFDSAIQANAKDFVGKVVDQVSEDIRKELIKRPSITQAQERANPQPAAESDDLFVFSDAWELKDGDITAASDQNGANLLAAANGASLVVLADHPLVIVGEGHNPFVVSYLRDQASVEQGTVTVSKGGPFDKGGLDVRGISMWEELVKDRLTAVSKKPINFLSD